MYVVACKLPQAKEKNYRERHQRAVNNSTPPLIKAAGRAQEWCFILETDLYRKKLQDGLLVTRIRFFVPEIVHQKIQQDDLKSHTCPSD